VRNGPRGIAYHQSSGGANRKNSGTFISTWVARLTRNPILKVLFSIRAHRVRALLMGGQACVFYGAAEFSRDTDLAILADSANLAKLKNALEDLQAVVIAVSREYGCPSFRVPSARHPTIHSAPDSSLDKETRLGHSQNPLAVAGGCVAIE